MTIKQLDVEKNRLDDFVTVLDKFGKYQIVQYILICLPVTFVSMMNVNYVFVAGEVEHRCVIPECEGSSPSIDRPSWWPDSATECERPSLDPALYKQHNGTCTKHAFSNDSIKCTDWVYESPNSIVAEMNLACQSWKAVTVGTLHNTGMLVSMPIAGWLADRYGRKPFFIVCSVGGCVGIIKSLITSYYWFIFLEFLESAISAGLYTVGSVLLIEIGGQNTRILSGLVFAYAIYMGEAIFACIAMAVPYWRTLIQIVYAPPILFILYIWVLCESPRWQILIGKVKEAKHTIGAVAKSNNINISTQELVEIKDDEFRKKFNVNETDKQTDLGQIWRSKEIRKRLLVSAYCRFSASFVYYGFLVNSVLLPGNKYTNFIVSALMSFPGELLSYFFMNRYGRKYPLITGFLVCGALCIALAFTPEKLPWLKIVLFVLGKFMVAMCFTGVNTYTLEMFPTSARGSIVGICSVFARIGSLLSPLTPLLTTIMPELLSLLFGASVFLAGGLLTLTPETKNMSLPDTIEQVEASCNNKETKEAIKK